MLSMTDHQGNAIQDIYELSPHSHACYQEPQNKFWQEYGEIGIPVHCWLECKTMQPLW